SAFSRRVALVTGASRGIGRAIALRLAGQGADVGVHYFRNREGAEKTAAEVEELGGRPVVLKGHLGDADRVRSIAEQLVGELGASKAALETLVRYLAVELAPLGIRANVVSAGVVDTDALLHFPNRDELLREAASRTPAGRAVTPEDVAEVVAFLCSDGASMI